MTTGNGRRRPTKLSAVTLGDYKPDLFFEKYVDWGMRSSMDLAVEVPRGAAGVERVVVQWRRGVERYDDVRRHEVSINEDSLAFRMAIQGLDARFQYAVRVSLEDRRGEVVGITEATGALRSSAYPVGPGGAPRVDAGGLSLLPGATWIDVVWLATAAATGHTVQWKPASDAGWDGAQQAIAAADATGHTLKGLTAGRRYTVRVRANTVGGTTGWFGAATTGLVSAAPSPLLLEGDHRSIVVSWGPPAGTGAGSVVRYSLQWRLDGESYDETRRRLMAVSSYDAEITELDNSVEYTVRLSALDSEGRSLGAAEGSVSPVSMADQIKAEIIDPRVGSHAWLRETWYEVPVEIRSTSWDASYYDRSVPALYLVPGAHSSTLTVLHELAHHFTLHPSIYADDPVGRLSVLSLWLYLYATVTDPNESIPNVRSCPGGVVVCDHDGAGELIAIVMEGFTQRGWSGSATTTAIAASVSAGELPQWFEDTYTSDGTIATADLDALWADFKQVGTNPYLGHLSELLEGLFGGYCSTAEARAALAVSATLNNAWVDGGCNNRRPQGLSAVVGGSAGEIHVAWQPPLYATTPATDRYVVQWKSDTQGYDTARQAVITDLNALSHTITGLNTATGYTVRVAAVNSTDTADLTDDDSRTRAAETTATVGDHRDSPELVTEIPHPEVR